MTDTQIQCFLTLAENLNYTKTAQIMGISQSTLSAHIAALEKGINHVLFVRNKRSVVLSVAGEIMYKTFKETTTMINNSIQQIEQMEQNARDRIVIGLMEGQWSQSIIENISSDFLQSREGIKIEINTFGNAELLEQLDMGNVDMILGYNLVLSARQDLRSIPIYESPMYLAMRVGYKLGILNNRLSLEEQRFILQDKENAPFFEKYYEDFCRLFGVFPTNVIRVENKASVMFNVEMGRGVGFIDDLSIIYGKSQFSFEQIEGICIKYDLIYKPGHTKELLSEYIEYLKKNYLSRMSSSNWSAGL